MDIDLYTTPIAKNPDGSPPDFTNGPSLAPVTYGVSITLIVISFTFLSMRIYANAKTYSRLLIDDYFCIIGWVLTTIQSALVMTMHESARHSWDVRVSAFDAPYLKGVAVLCMLYGPSMFCAKTAIFAMYMRLFGNISWVRWACWFGIVFFGLVYWSNIPVYAVYAFPHHANEKWDITLASKMTQGSVMTGIVTGSFNVLSDFYALILPLPVIISLKLSLRKKVGLCVIFMTGLIGVASSVLSLYFRTSFKRKVNVDSTWHSASAYLTVIVELNIAIIVSCGPASVMAWKKLFNDSSVFLSLKSIIQSSKATILSRNTMRSESTQVQDSESYTNLHSKSETHELSEAKKPFETYNF